MKIKKILIIFLVSLIFTFIIYKINYKKKINVTLIGDNNIKSLSIENYISYLNKDSSIDKVNDIFTFDYKNYKNIKEDIKNNKYIYYKDKKVYLNQQLSDSEIIILNANNDEYLSKCKKSNRILKEYNYKIYKDTKEVVELINKISNSKIIILGNYCSNYNKEISNYLSFLYKDYNYINMYKLYNEYKDNNFEYQIYKRIKSQIG